MNSYPYWWTICRRRIKHQMRFTCFSEKSPIHLITFVFQYIEANKSLRASLETKGAVWPRVVSCWSLGYIHIRCVSAAAVAIDLCTLGCVMHIGQYPWLLCVFTPLFLYTFPKYVKTQSRWYCTFVSHLYLWRESRSTIDCSCLHTKNCQLVRSVCTFLFQYIYRMGLLDVLWTTRKSIVTNTNNEKGNMYKSGSTGIFIRIVSVLCCPPRAH